MRHMQLECIINSANKGYKTNTMINYTISGEGINPIDCFSIKDVRDSITENVNGCLDLLIEDYLIIYKEGKTMLKIGTIYINEYNKIKLEYHTHYKKDANGDIGN